jgi:Predicted ABC-type transport system involved in lysophospholipase L1 biosynthesis, permease component
MNFLKRAVLSITRRKGKSIILLVIVFILGNVIAGAVSVRQATANVEKSIKQRLGAVATVEWDYEALDKANWLDDDGNEIGHESISVEVLKSIGELPQVKSFDYTVSTGLGSILKNYVEENENMNNGMVISSNSSNDFNIKGINYVDSQANTIFDIEAGRIKLVDGRVFTAEEINNGSYVGLISKEIAELNNLRIGDVLPMKNTVYDNQMIHSYSANETPVEPSIFSEQDVPIEVIGIFEPIFAERAASDNSGDDWESMNDMWMRMDQQNRIYVPAQAAIQEYQFVTEQYLQLYGDELTAVEANSINNVYYDSIYNLNSPEDIEAFREAAGLLLPKYQKVVASSDSYYQIAGAIISMQTLSTIILYVAIFATILILTLLIILFLRDRKHEFGIYLSLGERRRNLISQVVLEVIAVAFVAISASLVSGNFVARGISDMLITNQLVDQSQTGSYYGNPFEYNGYGTTVSETEIIESYDVGFDMIYIVLIYGIGLGTTIVATVGPMVYLLRLNPKKILL